MGAWTFIRPRFENMCGRKISYRGRPVCLTFKCQNVTVCVCGKNRLHVRLVYFTLLFSMCFFFVGIFRKAPQLLSEFRLGTKLKQKVLLLMHLKAFEGRLKNERRHQQLCTAHLHKNT